MKRFLSMIVAMFLLGSLTASAAIFDNGEHLIISDPIFDDVYFAAGNFDLRSDVSGDLYVVSGNITIDANVSEDLIVLGGRVSILGDVSDDLRVFGGTVLLDGNVGDDLIIGGGVVDISMDSVVSGDVVIGAGVMNMAGEVLGNLTGAAGMADITGKVNGNVTLTVEEKLNIDDGASIGGDLKYSALLDMQVPDGVVAGEIKFNKFEQSETLSAVTSGYLFYKVFSYLALLLLTFVLVLAMPKGLASASTYMKGNILKSFAFGIVTVIVGFLGTAVLLATVIGIPISFILIAALFIGLYVSKVFVGAWIASYFIEFPRKKKHPKLYLFFGTAAVLLAYSAIGLIPVVGWAFNSVLLMVGFGALVLTGADHFNYLRDKGRL